MASKPPNIGLWFTIAFLHILTTVGVSAGAVPYFTRAPQDVIAVRNSPLLWPCDVHAATPGPDGEVHVSWRRHGNVLNTDRVGSLGNGTLRFSRVKKTDAGLYECVARDKHGAIVSHPARLHIAYLSRFGRQPEEVALFEGQSALLRCEIEGLPEPAISWEKDGLPIPAEDDRYTVLASGGLQLAFLRRQDAGSYRCAAVNSVKSRVSQETQLTVLAASGAPSQMAPTFLVEPKSQDKQVGETVVLECVVSGLPQPTIAWSRTDGEAVPLGDRYSIVGQGSLRITDLQDSDASTFICKASNSHHTISAQADLRVLLAPLPDVSPEAELQFLVHMTLVFTCSFRGHPAPTVRWTRDGLPVAKNNQVKIDPTGELTMYFAGVNESGYYQCWGENDAGSAQVTFKVVIYEHENPPQTPPKNLVAETLSSTSIRVSWESLLSAHINNSQEIIAYSVHYRATDGEVLEKQLVIEPEINSYTFDSLDPFTNYTFYVVSFVAHGISPQSERVTACTDEDVPLKGPPVTVTAEGGTQLRVEWGELPLAMARGIITKYRVMYYKEPETSKRVVNRPAGERHYLLTELEPSATYRVLVLAGTKAGFPNINSGATWPWVEATTGRVKLDGTPSRPSLRVQSLNATALRASWTYPDTDPSPSGFRLSYLAVPGNQSHVLELPATDTMATITGLSSNTKYEMELRAYNEQGESEMVKETFSTDGSRQPPAPRDLEITPLNSSAIRVTWGMSAAGDSHTVSYHPLRGEGEHQVAVPPYKTVTSSEAGVDLVALDPYTVYELTVQTHQGQLAGPFSDPVRCRTLDGLPSAPTNLRAQVDTSSGVVLGWEPPRKSNGVIRSYVIYYHTDGALPEDQWLRRDENGTTTQAYLSNLEENEVYYFKMRAATGAGAGEPTGVVSQRTLGASPDLAAHRQHEKRMGITIGVCIGGGCLIICALIIVFRNKCCPPPTAPTTLGDHSHGNGTLSNGYIPNGCSQCNAHALALNASQAEVTPMLLPEVDHLDTKGGYHGNGVHHGNGIAPRNGLQTAVMPNGEIRTFLVRECSASSSTEDGVHIPLSALFSGSPVPCHQCAHCSLEDIDHDTDLSRTPSRSTAGPPDTDLGGQGDLGGLGGEPGGRPRPACPCHQRDHAHYHHHHHQQHHHHCCATPRSDSPGVPLAGGCPCPCPRGGQPPVGCACHGDPPGAQAPFACPCTGRRSPSELSGCGCGRRREWRGGAGEGEGYAEAESSFSLPRSSAVPSPQASSCSTSRSTSLPRAHHRHATPSHLSSPSAPTPGSVGSHRGLEGVGGSGSTGGSGGHEGLGASPSSSRVSTPVASRPPSRGSTAEEHLVGLPPSARSQDCSTPSQSPPPAPSPCWVQVPRDSGAVTA